MRRPPRKFVLDTQLFIRAFRDQAAKDALQAFHRGFAPFEYLSVIVAHELRSGIRRDDDLLPLERRILAPFQRTGRLVTPSAAAWAKAGDVLAAMARREGLVVGRVSKAFANDVLLAVSCREAGCTLVTDNDRDFHRIQRFVSFEYTKPWPGI